MFRIEHTFDMGETEMIDVEIAIKLSAEIQVLRRGLLDLIVEVHDLRDLLALHSTHLQEPLSQALSQSAQRRS